MTALALLLREKAREEVRAKALKLELHPLAVAWLKN